MASNFYDVIWRPCALRKETSMLVIVSYDAPGENDLSPDVNERYKVYHARQYCL